MFFSSWVDIFAVAFLQLFLNLLHTERKSQITGGWKGLLEAAILLQGPMLFSRYSGKLNTHLAFYDVTRRQDHHVNISETVLVQEGSGFCLCDVVGERIPGIQDAWS